MLISTSAIVSLALLLPQAGPAGAPTTFTRLTDQESRAATSKWLHKGEKLAHAAYRGPFGPGSDNLFVVVEAHNRHAAFVVAATAPGKSGPPARVDLPAFETHAPFAVTAVLFVSVDGDDRPEAVVLAQQMTGIGPEGAKPFPVNHVFRWNGKAFERLAEAEKAIDGLATVKQVEARLVAMGRLVAPKPEELQPPASTKATSFCKGRAYPGKGGRHLSWEAFASAEVPAAVEAAYIQRLGGRNRKARGKVTSFAFPLDKPTAVVSVQPAGTRGPWTREKGCKVPAGSKTVVVVSSM